MDCEDQNVDVKISAITCTTNIDLYVVSNAPVVVFDLETTGLSEYLSWEYFEIWKIACARVHEQF